MLLERVAAVRRKTQPEFLLGGGRQPTVAQVGPSLGAERCLQLLLEEACCHFHDIVQAGALAFASFVGFVARRHRHAGHVGDALDGFRKTETIQFGQEAEMIAGHAAAEAVVAALLVFAMEGWRLLAMERTAGPIVAPRRIGLAAVPRHALADHGRDRHAVAYLIEEGGRKAHGII